MFNRELFYALCDKYGVEFSDQYDKPMLKTEDGLRELVEQDVKDIFSKRQKIRTMNPSCFPIVYFPYLTHQFTSYLMCNN